MHPQDEHSVGRAAVHRAALDAEAVQRVDDDVLIRIGEVGE